ncbi:MAG: TetR family transcriptional regulator [Cyanobacteria bacterium J06643_4]
MATDSSSNSSPNTNSKSDAASSLRRQPQQKRSQQRIEKMMTAAAELFWEVGYEATTTHAIAKRSHTAVGTLYRFFPNKLAIFHALENQHRQGVENIHAQLMTPEFVRQPLADMVQQMVETFAAYFEDVRPRVVYTQYYLSPELYAQFDESVDYGYIRRFAIALRTRNARLPIDQSELIAEVFHRTFNAIFVSALRSEPAHKQQLYQELQRLLINYLKPYDIECHKLPTAQTLQSESFALNARQRLALSHLKKQGQLTIKVFETLCPQSSRRTLQRDLKQLVEQGLLQATGETNQLTYHLTGALSLE